MAIFYVRTKFLGRAKGYNAVHAAAYRRATTMEDAANAVTYNYTCKSELEASGLAYPRECPRWFKSLIESADEDAASARFWNFVEHYERRKDAQLASETVIAVPRELSADQAIVFAKEYADELAREGFFVDWAFHNQGTRGQADHNPHLHIMTSLRPMTKQGFGPKRIQILDDHGQPVRTWTKGGWRIKYKSWAGDLDRWKERDKLAECLLNKHLAMAGFDLRVDARSNAEKHTGMGKSLHIGPGASAMEKRGEQDVRSVIEHARRRASRRQKVREDSGLVLDQITEQKSVFTEADIRRTLSKLGFEADEISALKTELIANRNLVHIATVNSEKSTKSRRLYTTSDMQMTEHEMIAKASLLHERSHHKVARPVIESALQKYSFLSEEQRGGVRFLIEPGALKSLVGLAGAGKSTLLKAANEAWEASGYQVKGIALAGKAADELRASSGIDSRTLASFSFGLAAGRIKISERDVIVLDEAGMVGSRDMVKLIDAVKKAGAKLVMVGDPDQLPAISAGAAFRAVLEEVHSGYRIQTIRRQAKASHKVASQHFANFKVDEGLAVYESEKAIIPARSMADAVEQLSSGFVKDYLAGKDALALSYKVVDVRALNMNIRARLKREGCLGDEVKLSTTNRRGDGHLDAFSVGDKIVFLQNDKGLKVKNGTAAVLTYVSETRVIAKVADRLIEFDPQTYRHFTYGYAVTIHKSQGASVDHTHLLASELMTRNLTYVGMTRHKQTAKLYYDETAFKRGLGQTIGRADEKLTTRDFLTKEDRIRFGERRGYEVRSHDPNVEAKRNQARLASNRAPAAELDQQDWCIPPKSEFERPVEVVAKAVAIAAAKSTLSDGSRLLTKVLGRDRANRFLNKLEEVVLTDDNVFEQIVGIIRNEMREACQKIALSGSKEHRGMLGDRYLGFQRPEAVTQNTERKVESCVRSIEAWRTKAKVTFVDAVTAICSRRRALSKGLRKPAGELGEFLKRFDLIDPTDRSAMAEVEQELFDNSELRRQVADFERKRNVLIAMHSRSEGRVQSRVFVNSATLKKSAIGKCLDHVEDRVEKAKPTRTRSLSM